MSAAKKGTAKRRRRSALEQRRQWREEREAEQREFERRELWRQAFVAAVGAKRTAEQAINLAAEGLQLFDLQFPIGGAK